MTSNIPGLKLDFSKSPTVWKFLNDDSFVRGMVGPGIPIAADIAGMIITNGVLAPLTLGRLGTAMVQNLGKLGQFTTAGGQVTGNIMLNFLGSGIGYALGDMYRDAAKMVYLNPDKSEEEIFELFKTKYEKEARRIKAD